MSYTPKTRLEKLLMGRAVTPRNGLEKAVKAFMDTVPETLTAHGTIGEDENEKATITLDVAAAALYEAARAGSAVAIETEMEDVTLEYLAHITGLKATEEGTDHYDFRYADTDGKTYAAEGLGGTDAVVLTEV